MSHQSNIKVALKDTESLIEALVDCGIPRDEIVASLAPQHLIDYTGKKTRYVYNDTQDPRFKEGDVAHVIVRRKTLQGSHNDLGFFVDGDDSRAIVCEYTKTTGSPVFKNADGERVTTDKWLAAVKQQYAFHVAKKTFAKVGKKVHAVRDGGKLRLYVKA